MSSVVSPSDIDSTDSKPLDCFLRLARDVAAWCVIALLAVLPYFNATKSLEEFLIYGPAALLLLIGVVSWIGSRGRKSPARVAVLSPLVIQIIVVIVVTALISVYFSMDVRSSAKDFKQQMLKFILIFWLVLSLLRTAQWRKRAYLLLFVTGVGAAVYTLVGYYSGRGVDPGPPVRALGPVWSYTRTAMYFTLWIPMALAGLLYSGPRRWWVKGLMIAGILVAWWAVIMTQTRGAMIAIFLATVVLAGLKHWKWGVGLLVVILLSALLTPSFRDRCLDTVQNISRPNALLSDRVPLWKNALTVIREHPLIGVGYGSEIFQSKTVRLAYPMFNYKYQPHAHQFYFETAAESGLIHLAALLALFHRVFA